MARKLTGQYSSLTAHMTSHDPITGGQDSSDKILQQLEDTPLQREIHPGVVVNLEDPSEYGASCEPSIIVV